MSEQRRVAPVGMGQGVSPWRAVRWGAGAGVVLVSLAVTGCSFGASGEGVAEQVVTDFFDRLIEGDAAGAGSLLSDRSVVSPAALEDEVYSEAVRPVEARITFVQTRSVGVEYLLDGESVPREITVKTTIVDDEPKITGWGDLGLAFDGQGFPGDLVIESAATIDLSSSEPLKLLPGIYGIEYTDEQELITIDPSGGDADPFALEFPVDPKAVEAPPGAEMFLLNMVFHPVLRADVAIEAQARIDELIASCAASGLLADECPSAVADGVANRAYEARST